MTNEKEDTISGKYMIRKKFFIPKEEFYRDYRDGHEKYPSNFFFECDLEDLDDKDSFNA